MFIGGCQRSKNEAVKSKFRNRCASIDGLLQIIASGASFHGISANTNDIILRIPVIKNTGGIRTYYIYGKGAALKLLEQDTV